MNNEMQYNLKENLEYSNNGEQTKAQFIMVSKPTARNIADIAPVKSEVMKAVQWAQEQNEVEVEETKEDKTIDPETMMMTLELAPGVDVAKVILHIHSMLVGKNGLAKIEGEVRYTQPLADELDLKDVYGITGFFLVNFIVPSL